MEEDKWRVGIIGEIMDMKNGNMVTPAEWSVEELDEILNFACVSYMLVILSPSAGFHPAWALLVWERFFQQHLFSPDTVLIRLSCKIPMINQF